MNPHQVLSSCSRDARGHVDRYWTMYKRGVLDDEDGDSDNADDQGTRDSIHAIITTQCVTNHLRTECCVPLTGVLKYRYRNHPADRKNTAEVHTVNSM